jgi:hypothetical protein
VYAGSKEFELASQLMPIMGDIVRDIFRWYSYYGGGVETLRSDITTLYPASTFQINDQLLEIVSGDPPYSFGNVESERWDHMTTKFISSNFTNRHFF